MPIPTVNIYLTAMTGKKKQPDWLEANTDAITTQSHSLFARSRENKTGFKNNKGVLIAVYLVPLLTALSSKSPEIAYSVVCHIEIILQQAPALFEDSVSSLYCR
jgi:hypothetical protein